MQLLFVLMLGPLVTALAPGFLACRQMPERPATLRHRFGSHHDDDDDDHAHNTPLSLFRGDLSSCSSAVAPANLLAVASPLACSRTGGAPGRRRKGAAI